MDDHRCSSVLVVDDETDEHVRETRAHASHHIAAGPARVAEQYDRRTGIARFNAALAVAITKGVGSMWCAYAFAAVALFGLPGAIHGGVYDVVQWIAQTFLQLVLLSIILVGQNVQAAASDKRARDTFTDAEMILTEVAQIHTHLQQQDKTLLAQHDLLAQLRGRLDGTPPAPDEPQG